MIFADIYDRLIFIVLICSSVFNVLCTITMNKKASLFKLLGSAFFIPASLCCITFIFSANIPASLVVALSEFCLATGIFLLLFHPYNSKHHNPKAAGIVLFSLVIATFSIKSDKFLYYLLPFAARSALTALLIILSILHINKKKYDQKLIIPLSIWLAGIALGFFEKKAYVKDVLLFIKIGAYISFLHYFYSTIYKAFIDKINESEEIIEAMEHSLNKEVRKRVFEIERSNERLLEMSKTDLLTKAYNKITTLNIIEKLINNRKSEVFTIIMFDIDNFKTINDSLGHVTGDMCLKTLANIASGNIREVDFLGRYGGDEFIIVLPNLGSNEGKFVAERFKNKVNETSNPKFTVSIGIATYPEDGKTVHELISVADRGLYKSKSRGKNAISHA